MADNVFERREKKYLVDPEQRCAIERAALGHMVPDAHGRTLVTSVYLDTPDRSIIARSLEKPRYKEKLRLRAYGVTAGEALVMLCRDGMDAARATYGATLDALPVYFELKKKFEGIVYKRRVRSSLSAAWAFSRGSSFEAARAMFPLVEGRCGRAAEDEAGCLMSSWTDTSPRLCPLASERGERCSASSDAHDSYLDGQIARELEAALGRYVDLRPSAAILCWRTAWMPEAGEDSLRLTFDEDLSFVDLADAADAALRPIVASDTAIMELKAAAALPSWLIGALSAAGTRPRSFSKYGEAARIMDAASERTILPSCAARVHTRAHGRDRCHQASHLVRAVRSLRLARPLKKGA